MQKNMKLRMLEHKCLACYAPIYKAGETFEGTIYEMSSAPDSLSIDLLRGGNCTVVLGSLAGIEPQFKIGDKVELVYMPQAATRWDPEKSFSLSFRYLKTRFPDYVFGDERIGTVLVRGTNAILVLLDEEKEIVGRYLPPYGAIPDYLQKLSAGDKVICTCTQNGDIVNIDEMVYCEY
ncbi:MAG: hypothetical protein IJ479_07875 [Alphaproteobacteria bacterium]|nr:hypothetical protein [Alphaproteobacteria bacterium]